MKIPESKASIHHESTKGLRKNNLPFWHPSFRLSLADSAKVAPDGLRRGTSCLPNYFWASPKIRKTFYAFPFSRFHA